jgi:hypothetical protein
MGYSFEKVSQLHRLSVTGMKLFKFVGLVNVSIAIDIKTFKNVAKKPK